MNEEIARRIFQAAIDENRCVELSDAFWNGGSATVDAATGKLVVVSGDQINQMMMDRDNYV